MALMKPKNCEAGKELKIATGMSLCLPYTVPVTQVIPGMNRIIESFLHFSLELQICHNSGSYQG